MLIPETSRFVPLVLQFDLRSLREKETWLDTDLACILPIAPDATITEKRLREAPAPGRAFCDFYDSTHMKPKAEGKYVGRYRKVMARESNADSTGEKECQLVTASPQSVAETFEFKAIVTAEGPKRNDISRARPKYVMVRNLANVAAYWDGVGVRNIFLTLAKERKQLLRTLTSLYGEAVRENIEWWASYALPVFGKPRGEPVFSIAPWLFFVSPPGWSCVADTISSHGLDGMRGVISTDRYPGVMALWQITRLGPFQLRAASPILRLLPVPRRYLFSSYRDVPADA
jgi:hypothetical protein